MKRDSVNDVLAEIRLRIEELELIKRLGCLINEHDPTFPMSDVIRAAKLLEARPDLWQENEPIIEDNNAVKVAITAPQEETAKSNRI